MYKAMCTCQAKGPRATLVDFGNGVKVGLMGLEETFERFRAEGRTPSPALGEDLLAAIRTRWKKSTRLSCCANTAPTVPHDLDFHRHLPEYG
jgi:hypothetical protein